MPTLYNRIANQNLDRLAALSDGVFAFAMTLLALDIRLPDPGAIHSEHDLWRGLLTLGPSLAVYLMSFITLGIFWNGQQTQLNYVDRGNRDVAWIQLAFLFTITLMPLTTRLLAQFIHYRTAVLVYWLNIMLPGLLLYCNWMYVCRHNMIREDTPEEVRVAIWRRVTIAQTLYAVGAALCILGTAWSVAFILAVQLNYAAAPRLPGRRAPKA